MTIYLVERLRSVEVYQGPITSVYAVVQSTDSPAVSKLLVTLIKVVLQNLQN